MLKGTSSKREIADTTSKETPKETSEKTSGRMVADVVAGDQGNGEETAFDKVIKAEMERVRNRISLLKGEIDELEKRLKMLNEVL